MFYVCCLSVSDIFIMFVSPESGMWHGLLCKLNLLINKQTNKFRKNYPVNEECFASNLATHSLPRTLLAVAEGPSMNFLILTSLLQSNY